MTLEKNIEEIIKINVDFISNKDGISYEDSKRLPTALTIQLLPLFKKTSNAMFYINGLEYDSILQMLCEAFGWQGGTIHQVLEEIKRLKKLERTPNDKGD